MSVEFGKCNEHTFLEINNSEMYSKPAENCEGCGLPLNIRVVFINVPKNCEDYTTYPYMKIGQSMHMECYIQRVIDIYLAEKTG